MNKWISIKDQTPLVKKSYLTFCRFKDGQTEQKIKLWLPNEGRFSSQPTSVLYWMELPRDPVMMED